MDDPDLPQDRRFAPGTVLAKRYRIVTVLGRGGMGEVYRAEDVKLGETVALKFLPAEVAGDPHRMQQLYEEVRVGRKVSHPNVCRIHDVVEAEGHAFITMEYVDGEDLESLLARIGRLAPAKALDLARDLCAGLHAIHERDVVHRDLKPANVMVDGRGRARITDFGVAARAIDLEERRELAGTMAYMAPEQRMIGDASARSDLYSLGLVLYEMFTGEKAFEASTTEEMARLQREPIPSRLATLPGVEPSVERIVVRCLAFDPEQRPDSAREVLATLPGGDPLEAAVAAGETPAPEIVAAAGEVGDLRPSVAWALLAGALAGLGVVFTLASGAHLHRQVGLPHPPVILGQRAEAVLAAAGVEEPPGDRSTMFQRHQTGAIERFYGELRPDARPAPIRFFYRRSLRPLRPLAGTFGGGDLREVGYSLLGLVRENDPAFDSPGDAIVFLEPGGELVEMRVIPPDTAPRGAGSGTPAWDELLSFTGVEASSLRSVPPRWAPPVPGDSRLAWMATYSGQEETVRIEAASFGGRPTWLRVVEPWAEPRSPAPWSPGIARWIAWMAVVFAVTPMVAGVFVVLRNLRQGRGDRRGAFRLALFCFGALSVAALFRVEHQPQGLAELHLVWSLLAQSVFMALLAWGAYLAVEPYVRKRWPRTLISWTRLLAGRVRDPMVGRDVLVGIFAGVVLLSGWAAVAAVLDVRRAEFTLSTLSAARHAVYYLLYRTFPAIYVTLGLLFALVLFRVPLRSTVVAAAVISVILLVPYVLVGDLSGLILMGSLFALSLVLVVRFGLLSATLLWYVFLLYDSVPMALDPSAWYFGRSLAVALLLAGITVWAFVTSLGDRPIVPAGLLEG